MAVKQISKQILAPVKSQGCLHLRIQTEQLLGVLKMSFTAGIAIPGCIQERHIIFVSLMASSNADWNYTHNQATVELMWGLSRQWCPPCKTGALGSLPGTHNGRGRVLMPQSWPLTCTCVPVLRVAPLNTSCTGTHNNGKFLKQK